MGNSNHIQRFGDSWTEVKLKALDNYLEAYCKIMKNQNFKTYYIDAFAGSGEILLKQGREIKGSAAIATKYDFDYYIFVEENEAFINMLEKNLMASPKYSRMLFVNKDCNDFLERLDQINWIGEQKRGVIFLDPYAMQLSWSTLEKIAKTKALDVWYLFPLMASNRTLFKDKVKIKESTKKQLTRLFGTTEWEEEIYRAPEQISLFDGPDNKEKVTTEELKKFILKRLNTIFPAVSNNAVVLKNSRNAPMFLLCFAVGNPSNKAKAVAMRVADYLLKHME
ncbi:MAG: three-Cys-motif partner protein TcmP [Bacillota bacterium]|nr:three-Cys-motif partner protein TcmP [Bacillota bacterium]